MEKTTHPMRFVKHPPRAAWLWTLEIQLEGFSAIGLCLLGSRPYLSA